MQHSYRLAYRDIIVEPLQVEHIEALRVLRNASRESFLFSEILSSVQQASWYENYLSAPDDYMFQVVTAKDPSVFVGAAALYHVARAEGKAEFGRLLIDRKWAGKGFGAQVLIALCKTAFNKLGLSEVVLEVFEANKAAFRIYEDVGFSTYEHRFSDGKEVICMRIKKEDLRERLS